MKKSGILLALCLCLAGCGEAETGERHTEEAEKTVLEFYTWTDEEHYMTEAVRAFMETYPDIQVNLHLVPTSEYAQTLSVLHNTEERGIDVFAESKPSAASADVRKGFAADMTDMADFTETPEEYGEMAESLKMDGKVYMMPYRKSTWAVYYNKEVFDRAGMEYPEGDWSWKDYTETAKALTGEAEGERVYGSMSYETSSMWWRTPVRTAGIENSMTPEALDKLKEAARWNYQMAYEWRVQPAFTELTDVNSYDYVARFLTGNIGMFYCGDWSMEMIERQAEEKGLDFDYDVAPLPGPGEGERYMPVTPAVLQISSRSEHPKEAFLLVRFLAGEEGAEILAENGILPAWDTEETRKILQNRPEAPEHIGCFWDYEKAVYTFPNEEMEEALWVTNKYVGQYFLQEMGLEEAFQNIEDILTERGLLADDEEEN